MDRRIRQNLLRAGIFVLVSLLLTSCATGERDSWRWPWEKPRTRSIKLAVYLADTKPADGYREYRDEYGVPIYVSSTPIVTEKDVVNAEAMLSDLRSVLILRFDPMTASELESTTADNVGKRLAVFVDGDYAVSAIIDGPVTEGGLALDIGLPREEVEAIIRGFAERQSVGPAETPH